MESLLSVPGVDMVQFGPGDYSINIGRPGDTDHPEIKEGRTIYYPNITKNGYQAKS
ncbi:MAG: hypothetical protein CM1200mP37_7000 [Chloroflexota bacterium]|nr:MAG: hypothetical protein CM1200mP37_7000 [Chloroflexota bacterium]